MYAFLAGWVGGFYGAASLSSLFSGLLSIYLLYKLAWYLYDEKTALISSGFLAVSWWHVVYSRVLLIDVFALLLILWAIYENVKYLNKDGSIWKATASLVLAFYSKYYALLLIPILGVYALLRLKRTDFGNPIKLTKLLTPLTISVLMFFPWLIGTDFLIFHHHAATYFLFSTFPHISGFLFSYVLLLTPIILILTVLSYKKYREIGYLPYLICVIPFLFYLTYAYLGKASHALVNQANYMLFTLPFLCIMASKGWELFEKDLSGKKKLIFGILIVLLSLFPLSFSEIKLMYDKNYETYHGNIEMVSPEITKKVTPEALTTRIIYFFQRKPFFSQTDSLPYHLRWVSPTELSILALESKKTTLSWNVLKIEEEPSVLLIKSKDWQKEYIIEEKSSLVSFEFPLEKGFNKLVFLSEPPSGNPLSINFLFYFHY